MMSEVAEADELILYATPRGPLAARCKAFWSHAGRTVPSTVAQTYPPHVTLTGFFRRSPSRTPHIVAEVAHALEDLGAPPAPVHSIRLEIHDDWIGLVLASPFLRDAAAAIVTAHEVRDGEDDLRPKEWLHLSLAYGEGFNQSAHGELAANLFAPIPGALWTVGLWSRRAAQWNALHQRPIGPPSAEP